MEPTYTTVLSSNVQDLSSLRHFVAEARAYLKQPITVDTTEVLTDAEYPHALIRPLPPQPLAAFAKRLKINLGVMLDPGPDGDLTAFKRAVIHVSEILAWRTLDGEEDAAEALVDAAGILTAKVKEISLKRPELFRTIARQRCEWPSLISFHGDWKAENEEIIKSTELGTEHPMWNMKKISKRAAALQQNRQALHVFANRLADLVEATRRWLRRFVLPAASWSQKAGLRKCALDDVQRLANEDLLPWMIDASHLGPLCKENALLWFNAGWEAFKDLTNGKPETLPRLADVGEYRSVRKKNADMGKGARQANIREGAKIQLRKAFLVRFGK